MEKHKEPKEKQENSLPVNFPDYFLDFHEVRKGSNETLFQGRLPSPIPYDIYGSEIVDIRRRIDKLEQKEKQQIIPIQFLESERLILKQSIFVNLSYYSQKDFYIIDCPELEIYSEGRDEQEAIKDFKVVLEEIYFGLKKDEGMLGTDLEKKWNILRNLLQEK